MMASCNLMLLIVKLFGSNKIIKQQFMSQFNYNYQYHNNISSVLNCYEVNGSYIQIGGEYDTWQTQLSVLYSYTVKEMEKNVDS